MRVLFCSNQPHWPAAKVGGAVSAHQLCQLLGELGVEVAMLSRHGGNGAALAPQASHSLSYALFCVSDPSTALHEAARAWGATALVVLTGLPDSPLLRAAVDTRLPTAVYVQSVDAIPLTSAWSSHVPVLRLANSDFTARRWRSLFGGAWHVIPPLVRSEDYATTGGTHDRVLFVNPIPAKGVQIALELAQACPDVPFTFVESWPLPEPWREDCRAVVEAMPNVEWLAAVDDMRSIYASARVMLVPSLCEETFGRVVVEAQSSGIPALVSDRGALPDVVGDGGLVLHAHADLAEWTRALRSLYASPSRWTTQARELGMRHSAATPLVAAEFLSLLTTHVGG